MATENRGVMVYLNPEIERELERYCIDNDITRKNKEGVVLPSLGTGIVQYLKSTLLSVVPSTVLIPPLGTVPHHHSSTSLSGALSNRLSTETKAEILELIAESSTNNTPNTVLTRADVVSIVRAEIDSHDQRLRQRALGLGSIDTEVTNEMMLAAASTSPPLALVPSPHKFESTIVATNLDPTNWELSPIANLVSTGISCESIAYKLNMLGFTNSKGGGVSRQSVESYLSRHSDLKAIYENARKEKKKKIAVSSTSG